MILPTTFSLTRKIKYMYTTYKINLTFDVLYMRADLDQASATIYTSCSDDPNDDNSFSAIPYQTADARHDLNDAAILAISYMGSDYWLDPSYEFDEDEDEDEYIAGLIIDIEEV